MSSTSENDSSDTTVQSKLDIEAFRQHLLNYRSKPDDSELESSYQLDLDSSFKRMLDEKRQMTNKENDPAHAPPKPMHHIIESTIPTSPIEKPLRRDLLKERLLHRINDETLNLDNSASYVCENSISTDPEYAAINRLMADFNINRDSTIGQKRSPLKMLRITGEKATGEEPFFSGIRKLHSPKIDFDARKWDMNLTEKAESKSDIAQSNADDTLEEMEYVLDRGLNYVPKRLIDMQNEERVRNACLNVNVKEETENILKEISISKNATNDNDNDDDDDDDDVIVIESSPENSFSTTQNTGHYKSALETTTDNTFYTAKTNLNSKSTYSIVVDDESPSKNDYKKKSYSYEDDNKNDIDDDDDVVTLEDKSFGHLSCNSSKNDSGLDFNDSLERVEYMMRQGEKLLNKKATPLKATALTPSKPVTTPLKSLTPAIAIATATVLSKSSSKKIESSTTPKPRTPIGGAIKKTLPLSSGKKPAKALTPGKTDLFKRPPRSPHPQSQSRLPIKSKIPTISMQNPVVSSLTKPQFRHIASPIAAYINNTPEVPLMKTIKPVKNLMTNTIYSSHGAKNTLDETTQSIETFPIKSALPKKMYISAPQRQIIDHRYMVTPGGKSVKKLIGNAPLVIRHDGKIKTNDHKSVPMAFEDSLADLSMASGDVSVQVVKDVHRI